MTSSLFSPGAVIAGKYRVERLLGQGGMGVVLAATQLELRRPVALKFMLPGALSRPQAEGRFQSEARAAAGLSSEHSVRIFDFGRIEDGSAYLVMEYLEGVDLAALIDRDGPLAPSSAVEYVLQAAVGLAEAHARGIVHRDIKPQNLFLTRTASGGARIKVLDFGISKVTPAFSDVAETKSGAVLGSPGYMAPEQMRAAHAVDARADIWALGCTLYKLLSGRDPFEGGSLAELCARVLHAEPAPLGSLRALPEALCASVHHCLAKAPEQRPATLAVMARELAPFAGGRGAELSAQVCGALGLSSEIEASALPSASPPVLRRGRGRAVAALSVLAAVGGAIALSLRSQPSASPSAPAAPRVVVPPAPERASAAAEAALTAAAHDARTSAQERSTQASAEPALRLAEGAPHQDVERPAERARARVLAAQRTPRVRLEAGVPPIAAESTRGGPEPEPIEEARDPRLMRH